MTTSALVIAPQLTSSRQASHRQRDEAAQLDEAIGLAAAIDLHVVGSASVKLGEPRPATLFGSGKVEEIHDWRETTDADLVIVDGALTPVQQRNLERAWDAKVLDRTALILEIFGARAQTKEGVLQVELAHLIYQKSRLVRSWTHLERQRGGVGFLGGPGETQIEADRREIQKKINKLEKALEDVKRTRQLHRRKRKRIPQPVVALVGYTNAGKSTLFNRLTRSDIFAKDLLFATLDPTLRQLKLPHGSIVILSDTVGFISDLPTQLIAAFQATLEEVTEADLILHVRDISHPDSDLQADDVYTTLKQLGLNVEGNAHFVEVHNKIDLLPQTSALSAAPRAVTGTGTTEIAGGDSGSQIVPVSAKTGEGVDALLGAIEHHMTQKRRVFELQLPFEDGEALAALYRTVEVLARNDDEAHVRITVRVPPERLEPFQAAYAARILD